MDTDESVEWHEAATTEFNTLVNLGTWTLVPQPANTRILRSMWVFKRKLLPSGDIAKYKRRLVVFGNAQVERVNYGDLFSPASPQESNRILMTVAGVNK